MSDLRPLTLKHLRAIAATVEHGSVTAAARALSVTPPAITMQLKLLEQMIGSPLFDRSLEGFVPTAVGEAVLRMANDVQHIIERSAENIEALRSGAAGTLVFAAVSTAKYFAPGIVASFQRKHPGLRVKLVVGNRSEIIAGLARSEYDIAIMGYPPGHLPLWTERLGDHPHIAIAPPKHRLIGDSDVLPDDLLAETFLAREAGSGTRLLMERFLDRVGSGRPFNIVEMGTNETIKQAVMAGLGLAILSAHTCHSEIRERKLAVLKLPGLPIIRQWFLVRRKDRTPSTASELFRAFVLANRQSVLRSLRA